MGVQEEVGELAWEVVGSAKEEGGSGRGYEVHVE